MPVHTPPLVVSCHRCATGSSTAAGRSTTRSSACASTGEAHIPGAVFLDVERDLSAPPGTERPASAADGRASSPRPPRARGSTTGVFVVAYGSLGGAERLWWLLRHFGHDDCAVLELDGWRGPLRGGDETVEPAALRRRASAAATRSTREELAARRERARRRRRAAGAALARRGEPRRPRARPDPGRAERAVERGASVAARRRARRLLRLRRHRLRRPPPPAPRRPRGAALPRLVVGVGAVSGAAGRTFDLGAPPRSAGSARRRDTALLGVLRSLRRGRGSPGRSQRSRSGALDRKAREPCRARTGATAPDRPAGAGRLRH